ALHRLLPLRGTRGTTLTCVSRRNVPRCTRALPGVVPWSHRHGRVLLRFGVAVRVRARGLAAGPAGGVAALFARADGDRGAHARRAAETPRRPRALRPARDLDPRLDESRWLRDRPARDDLVCTHLRVIAAGLARPFAPRPRALSRSPLREHVLRDVPRILEPRPARRRPARHATAGPLPRRGRKSRS